MPANLENSLVATGLEKVSFHSNHKERQCHRMLKLPHNYKEMATHFSTLAWKIPWTEEPVGLQSMGLQRVGHDWATSLSLSHTSKIMFKNSPSQVSTEHQPWISRCSSWIEKGQKNQGSNTQYLLDHRKSKRIPEKHLFLLYWLRQRLWLCRSQQTVENSSRDGPDKVTCLQRNLYADQEATVRIGYGTDWFQIGRGVC